MHIILLVGEILLLTVFALDLCRNSENVPGLFEISQNLNELPLKCKCGGSQDKGPIFSFHHFEEQKPKGMRAKAEFEKIGFSGKNNEFFCLFLHPDLS